MSYEQDNMTMKSDVAYKSIKKANHIFKLDNSSFSNISIYLACKRIFDIVGSLMLTIGLSPILIIIAILVKLTSTGDIIFKQRRVGLNGDEFWFYKFRSMTQDAESMRDKLIDHNHHGSNGVTFKIKNDPRITPVGRIIRRASLDELPQLWNVLKGDMSLVGPRPLPLADVARFTERDWLRQSVLPGITCFWQVRGRANIPFEEQVELDLEYINQRSLWLDAKLLVLTVVAVFKGDGAY